MSTPTLSQGQKFLALVAEADTTREQVQNLLANGDLVKALLGATDLGRVDRDAFRALLAPAPKPVTPIRWGSAADYAAKLCDWNDRFRFGLRNQQIDELFAVLPDHAGPLQPTGISLTLGKGLRHDWEVVMKVLEYELQKLGVKFTEYFDASRLSYFPGSEPAKAKTPQLEGALLDLQTFWDLQNGVMPREARRQRSRWPGLEVAWLLALNPEVFLAMNGETIPFMWATGLVVDSGRLPYFYRDSDGAFVRDYWGGCGWGGGSVVAFGEC